jgi:ribosome recycling factor
VINEIKKDASDRMDKSVKSLELALTKLRTGRAHTSLLDHITVEYYGSEVPINQCANVNVEDPRPGIESRLCRHRHPCTSAAAD